jgi:hypothetical protein
VSETELKHARKTPKHTMDDFAMRANVAAFSVLLSVLCSDTKLTEDPN